jgi:hypothetical protein
LLLASVVVDEVGRGYVFRKTFQAFICALSLEFDVYPASQKSSPAVIMLCTSLCPQKSIYDGSGLLSDDGVVWIENLLQPQGYAWNLWELDVTGSDRHV